MGLADVGDAPIEDILGRLLEMLTQVSARVQWPNTESGRPARFVDVTAGKSICFTRLE